MQTSKTETYGDVTQLQVKIAALQGILKDASLRNAQTTDEGFF
jgi:hypothetical protein